MHPEPSVTFTSTLVCGAGISSCVTVFEYKSPEIEYAGLAQIACHISTCLQQPEHSVAFSHASLHATGFTLGFGKLVDSDSERQRKHALVHLPKLVRGPDWQHLMPGAFSQQTLKMMAACSDKYYPDFSLVKTWLPRVIYSHESCSHALVPLLTRYKREYYCFHITQPQTSPDSCIAVTGL